MANADDFGDLDADLEGKKANVDRVRTNIMLSTKLKEKIRISYPDRSVSSVLEEGAMIKLRRDGHLPDKSRGVEPAGMEKYVAAKKVEKVALEEIKDRAAKAAPTKPKKP